ncbi:MAG TPA: hypothetical protein DIW44_07990 [Anaerolineaceae bacterium]|nr:hypothetical protein [Anaerolineaceae bacterium]
MLLNKVEKFIFLIFDKIRKTIDQLSDLSDKKKNTLNWLIISSIYLILILFYWAPFSWNLLPHLDLWTNPYYPEKAPQILDLIEIPFSLFKTRPFVFSFFHLGPMITPNSFIGYNIVIAITLYLKSIFTYALVKRILNGSIQIAFLAGVLAPIWPGESRIFELEYAAYHAGSLLVLISIYLLVCYWQKPKTFLLILSLYTLLWSLGFYEHAALTAITAPMIILIREKKITKRFIFVTSFWIVAPILKLLSFGFSLLFKSTERSYELSMLDISHPFMTIIETIKFCYESNFVSWFNRLWDMVYSKHSLITPKIINYSIFSCTIVVIVLIFLFILNSKKKNQDDLPSFTLINNHYRSFLIYCLASIYIAYFLFVPTSKRFLTIRTFIYPAVWTAISVSIILWIISFLRKNKFKQQIIYILLTSIITGAAILTSLLGHAQIIDYEVNYFGDSFPIFNLVPAIKEKTVVVLIDNTPKKSGFRIRGTNRLITRVLRFVYNDNSIRGIVCRQDDPGQTCVFEKEYLVTPVVSGLINSINPRTTIIDSNNDEKEIFTYDQMIILDYLDINHVTILSKIPTEFTFFNLLGTTPEEYIPYENICQNVETGCHSAASRLESYFGYAIKKLNENGTLIP